jgi:hypothetical protein
MSEKLLRNNDKPEFVIQIDGFQVSVDDGYNRASEILRELLKLNGNQFERYKNFIHQNAEILKLVPYISLHYYNGGDVNTFGEFFSEEIISALLETSLPTEIERICLNSFLEKFRKDQAREANKILPTFIYLMRDERTSYHKIGKSNNPHHRERTLQSDNPLIVLVDSWLGVSSDEKYLHKRFEKQRIRGEWFDLKEQDLQEIYNYFANKSE